MDRQLRLNLRRMPTKQVDQAREIWPATTIRTRIRTMGIDISGLHCPTTKLGRLSSDNGSCGSLYETGTLHRPKRKCDSNRRRQSLFAERMETSRTAQKHSLRSRLKMDRGILVKPMRKAWDQTKTVNSFPPTNGRTNGTSQPKAGNILTRKIGRAHV